MLFVLTNIYKTTITYKEVHINNSLKISYNFVYFVCSTVYKNNCGLLYLKSTCLIHIRAYTKFSASLECLKCKLI